ncbi:MAG: response regulator [Planctomycetota bacterium]|jgi:CheY-like chemotaxis protein/nitrogen-specific signal transduction histidine kinase
MKDKTETMAQDRQQPDEMMNLEGLNPQALQRLLDQKEAAIVAKGRLIDNMAYQIRTLSNAVIGFSDLMLTEELTDDQMEYIQEISQAGNGLSSLVNEVLDWAQLESGRMNINRTRCDLSEVLKSIEDIILNAAKERGIGYDFTIDPDLPAFIQSDADRVLKCLINLAANAIRHTEEGQIRLGVGQEMRDGELWIRFDVADCGPGFNDEQLSNIFEPALLHEEANAEVLTMLDMGLTVTAGLPLTKRLAEAMGGTISVRSEVNAGSTFSLLLPAGVKPGEGAKIGMPVQTKKVEQFELDDTAQTDKQESSSGTILLVEDQASNRTVISLMLEALGVEVDTAEDGVDGLEKASGNDYALILMDLKMPRMDGYEATRQIREKGIQTPIVALSAKVLNEDEHHKIASIFDGFVTKPVDSQVLLQTAQQYMPQLWDDQDVDDQSIDDEETVVFEYGS